MTKGSTKHETLGNLLGGLFVASLLTVLCVIGIAPNQANGALRAVAGGSGGGGTIPTATCASPGGILYASAGAITCNINATTDGVGAVSASASVTSPIVQSASNLGLRSGGASTDAATVNNNLVTFNGTASLANGTSSVVGLKFSGDTVSQGWYDFSPGNGSWAWRSTNGIYWLMQNGGPIQTASNVAIAWSGTSGDATAAADTAISRCAGAVLCVGNGTAADSSGSIKGVTTNSSAPAGSIAEEREFSVASTGAVVTASSNTAVTAVSSGAVVTAGDYDVTGVVCYSSAAATSFTVFQQGVSTVNNTLGPLGSSTSEQFAAMIPGTVTLGTSTAEICKPVPRQRITLAGTGTIYLVTRPVFSVSANISVYGQMMLRRAR